MLLFIIIYLYFRLSFVQSKKPKYRTISKPKQKPFIKHNKKPQWVDNRIIYYKAIMPKVSGYKISDIFNRIYGDKETVSKTYVYGVIKKYKHDILLKRKEIKNKKPYDTLINKIWGIDLTGKHDLTNQNRHILGIIDHGSRANIVLKYIANKSSINLLVEIYLACQKYGKPIFIRTDNDSVFKSRIFIIGLKLFGIKHQLTDIGCPWQNGRIERLFGTLKEKLNQIIIQNPEHLNWHLNQFRFWYNHVRTHMNLDGRTPIEVWTGKVIKRRGKLYEAWDGLLQGYWHPLKN